MVRSSSFFAQLLAVVAVPVAAAAEDLDIACGLLSSKHPGQTFFAGSDSYTYETQTQHWSVRAYDALACVFVPQDARQVSFAVTTLTLSLTQFAVRGGGHMPVVGYNSIGSSGVLLSTSNLTVLALSGDKNTVSVGAGLRWRDVYSYLSGSGLAAVGGRIGGVGVSGLLLGGGISFYSNQYGFAADNVVRYQAVLSSGAIVEATATNAYSDLFWALKGGGNSFAIVTRFNLKTVRSPRVWVGISQYAQPDSAKYLDAVYNFGIKYGSADGRAAIIPTILIYPSYNITAYAAARFYDSETISATVFENFTSTVLAPVDDSSALQSLAGYVSAVDALQPTGLRQAFRVLSLIVDRDAVKYVHDAFLAAAASKLAGIAGLSASITFQPITKEFIQQGIAQGGNPQGVDPSKAPYFWIVENLTWQEAEDDEVVMLFANAVNTDMEAGLEARGVAGGYLYLNDAGKGQKVFQSYPAANLASLKAIRTKYDPLRIYTNLLVGGWKVIDA
ncbi:FAD binding domain-containing protein [Colletotrichum caudatum]|nr:FAD binding domain-containing protein [Colletotrichum caudatum]